MGSAPRRIEVDADRIERWVAGFGDRHGSVERTDSDDSVRLLASDGSSARLEPLSGNTLWRRSLTQWAAFPPSVAVVLVRRGGYAVGLAEGRRLVAHKSGTRYVQSRTAAGGWSQQRFARRRSNQADALVSVVGDHAHRILGAGSPAALVAGGDRLLVADVLTDRRLSTLADLPRRELFDLADPNLAVLHAALKRGRAVRVLLEEA